MKTKKQKKLATVKIAGDITVGTSVFYIVTRMVAGAPWIAEGVVRAFCKKEPGKEQWLCIKVRNGSDFGGSQLAARSNVRRKTWEGQADLLEIMATMHQSQANFFHAMFRESQAAADTAKERAKLIRLMKSRNQKLGPPRTERAA